jgi:hypothetical protein
MRHSQLCYPILFITIQVTVITQDDLITALQLIHRGYKGVGSTFEHVNYLKWFVPLISLSLVGAYGLLITFLLIITSSDVIDLILNFTAIEFISLLGKDKHIKISILVQANSSIMHSTLQIILFFLWLQVDFSGLSTDPQHGSS